MNRLLIAGLGFTLWLSATIVFRFTGHLFFLVDVSWVMIVIWIVTFIALYGLAEMIFRWHKIENRNCPEAAIYLVVTGMLADALVVQFFSTVFPNMDATADGALGAWLLMGYSAVLIAGLWRGQQAMIKA